MNLPPKRLFGLEGSESLWSSLDQAIVKQIDPNSDKPTLILEFDVHEPIDHLPPASRVSEFITDWACDQEVDENWCNELDAAAREDLWLESLTVMLHFLASKVTYRMARDLVDTHEVIGTVDYPKASAALAATSPAVSDAKV